MNTQLSIQTDLLLDCMVILLFRSLSKTSSAYDVKEVAKFTKRGITYVHQTDFVFLLSSVKLSSSYTETDKQQLEFLCLSIIPFNDSISF